MRRSSVLILILFLFFTVVSSVAQQDYVSRYDAFAGYSFLSSPKLNLFERGFNGQFGVNVRRWVAIGGDFSVFTGHSTLFPDELDPAQQAKLAPIGPLLPPGFILAVPYDSTTYTFTAGPQLALRKFKWITLFAHPSIGGLHESVTAKPNNPILTQIVTQIIGPSQQTSDTVVFYGFGGGFDINASKHVALRLQSDFVHVNLFSGLLNGGRNSVRFSAGPTFRFGKNIAK
jgi:hypothetical protein